MPVIVTSTDGLIEKVVKLYEPPAKVVFVVAMYAPPEPLPVLKHVCALIVPANRHAALIKFSFFIFFSFLIIKPVL